MNQEIRRDIEKAREALKDYYGATTEVDWAIFNIGVNVPHKDAMKVERAAHRNEVILRGKSRLAHTIMHQTMSLAHSVWVVMGANCASEFWEKNREELSELLFDALEKTIKD